ncbi:HET-domain-containing protein, partial [Viridothelium virens]
MFPRLRKDDEARGLLDYDLIKSWLQICQDRHIQSCNETDTKERRFSDLYMIDVQTCFIKPFQRVDRYVALSYVWGRLPRARYENWNWNIFDGKSSSENKEVRLPSSLPRTIEDAITFTYRIGERYLWVDAFCINQHDPEHRQEQVNNMDLVYKGAYLTIIALDGENADAGLTGISRSLKQVQQPQVPSKLGRLVATHLPHAWEGPGTSHWDNRAWTMQEALFSRRCITFDHNQITWKCKEE